MPVAQGSIVSVVLGISIGSVLFNDVQTAAFVTTWLTAIMALVLGPLTIWLIHEDEREEKNVLVGAIIMMMVVSVLQLGFIGSEDTVELLRNVALMLMFFSVFMMSVHGYSRRVDRMNGKRKNDERNIVS
jgi:hypothetical protein